jgi:hypothetical protein
MWPFSCDASFHDLFVDQKQIAGYLIILRVAQGRAWETNTLATVTTIQFNSSTNDLDDSRSISRQDPTEVKAAGAKDGVSITGVADVSITARDSESC